MNLYKTSRKAELIEGGIVESVIAAESEEQARRLMWMGKDATVTLIGTAAKGMGQTLITSYCRRD